MAGERPPIELVGISKTYERDGRQIAVLRDVNLTIEQGDTISIVGRSGAGKSTLLHILGTLDRPTAGKMMVDGKNIFRANDRRLAAFRARRIGFVFQFHHLLPEFSALENAAMPAMIARLSRDEAHARAEQLLRRVGLGERMTHRPSELSGGEQQRVALARALVMRPQLLLADEPTGNLDEAIGQEIFDLFQELNSEMNVSVVVVTHHPGLAASMKRRLAVDGGVLKEAATVDIFDDAVEAS